MDSPTPPSPPSNSPAPQALFSDQSFQSSTPHSPTENAGGSLNRWKVSHPPSQNQTPSHLEKARSAQFSEPLECLQHKRETVPIDCDKELCELLSDTHISPPPSPIVSDEENESDSVFKPIPSHTYLRQFSAPEKMFSSARQEDYAPDIMNDRVVRKSRKRQRSDTPDPLERRFVFHQKRQLSTGSPPPFATTGPSFGVHQAGIPSSPQPDSLPFNMRFYESSKTDVNNQKS